MEKNEKFEKIAITSKLIFRCQNNKLNYLTNDLVHSMQSDAKTAIGGGYST
jgi:hypothetical protein